MQYAPSNYSETLTALYVQLVDVFTTLPTITRDDAITTNMTLGIASFLSVQSQLLDPGESFTICVTYMIVAVVH
jgi:hypothetical protein